MNPTTYPTKNEKPLESVGRKTRDQLTPVFWFAELSSGFSFMENLQDASYRLIHKTQLV